MACPACFAIFVLAGARTGRAQDAEVSRKLTLKEAVNLAVANSRDLALARLQYGVMQRQIGVARSAFLPNLYTGTGVAYTSGFPLLEGGGAPAIFSLSYTQQIFNPPLKGEQHAAEQRAEEQRLSMDEVRDTVMTRAALDYLELAKVRHALDLMHSERTSAGRILEATRERADNGRELPIEVIRATVEYGPHRTAHRATRGSRRFAGRRVAGFDGLAVRRADRSFHRGNSQRGRGCFQGRG